MDMAAHRRDPGSGRALQSENKMSSFVGRCATRVWGETKFTMALKRKKNYNTKIKSENA